MKRVLGALLAGVIWAAAASAETRVSIAYFHVDVPDPPTLSNLDPAPDDLGPAGAELGRLENDTTGKFLGQTYQLEVVSVAPDEDVIAAAASLLGAHRLVLLDAPADHLLEIADLPEAEGALLFNVSAEDVSLRDAMCRAHLLHTIPSYAMRADALMQFLTKRRWTDWVLIAGTQDRDLAFAEALKASSDKFRLRLRGEKTWTFDADMRRNAAQEVPLFTQDFRDHQILLIADEIGDFGRYIAYNTWEPRPVGGSEGIQPRAWSPVVEQWGAAQLQGRFSDLAGRSMRSRDYAAWAAVRSIGEAVTRTGQADAQVLRDYILSDAFELAGFKGQPMSYRGWNGQLRQPIPLVHARAVVALAPLDGFLHERGPLDTLGVDRPESACTAFEEQK